jgi:acyl-CoA hydrolase
MMADSFVDLYEQGKITGNRKNLDKGRMTYTFAVGSQRLYDFIDHNPACAIYPVDLVNMPHRIAMNDNQIAINNAVAVDLYGQVSSESEGFKQISGTGGQLEFTLGAEWSKGGAAYICMTSTTMHKGERVSRIVPYFSPGTIVTCTRGTVSNIVTEYGVANMMGKPVYDRAEMLINIAHPDFRDDLVKAAKEQKIWTRTNKIL